MAADEGAAGAGFEVAFEGGGFLAVREPDTGNHLPGAVLAGVRRLAPVMFGKALPGIGRDAGINSFAVLEAAEDVDVVAHDLIVEMGAGQATLKISSKLIL